MKRIGVSASVFVVTEVSLVVCLVFRVRELLNVWLELLKEDQAEGNERFRLDIFQILGVFDLIDVQEDVILPLEEGRLLLNERLYELSQEQNNLAVPISDVDHLL